MSIKSSLLRQVVADAKAVRATALANARATLEESFSTQVREMFAEKLRNETSEVSDEEQVSEVSAAHNVSKGGKGVEAPKTKDVSKGQPKKVSDAASHGKKVKAGLGPDGLPAGPDSIMKEVSEEPLGAEEAGLTSDELDEIIKELESEIHAEEGTAPEDKDAEAPEVPAVDQAPQSPVAPVNPAAPAVPPVNPTDPTAAPCAAPVVPQAPTAPVVPGQPPVTPPVAPVAGQDEEDINLEELLQSLSEEAEKGEDEEEDEEEETVDEAAKTDKSVPTNVSGQDADMKKVSSDTIEATGKNSEGCIGSGDYSGLKKENIELKKSLNEHTKVIEYLSGQLNEVNLLNAKLLYCNKIFKAFPINESQKKKVMETFDLTKNVREVKLTYTALVESLSFAGKKQPESRPALKPVDNPVVQLTEGFASRTVASTKPSTEIVSGGSALEMAERFRKLAGIPSPNK